jgi:hypothetical protein
MQGLKLIAEFRILKGQNDMSRLIYFKLTVSEKNIASWRDVF